MKLLALQFFWAIVVVYLLWSGYLLIIQDPHFICGFKLFFGDRSCSHLLR